MSNDQYLILDTPLKGIIFFEIDYTQLLGLICKMSLDGWSLVQVVSEDNKVIFKKSNTQNK